jgi:hypothetical protein
MNYQYPSEINFKKVIDGISVCYRDSSEVKYNLDIWAISYLLNEGLYNDNKKNIIQFDAININTLTGLTVGLRLYFLQKYQFYKKIFFDVKNVNEIKEKVEDIQNRIGSKYITYPNSRSEDFQKRRPKDSPEGRLEKEMSKDLSCISESEFVSHSDKYRTQFPANIFKDKISEEKRVTRKFWIDILAVNKFNQLSVIELKAGSNYPLDILIQAIDYGIYCHLFRKHIADSFFKNSNITDKIALYCVAEKFHPKLMGNDKIKGIMPLIQKNNLFDLILLKIKTKGDTVEGKPDVVYNSRLK